MALAKAAELDATYKISEKAAEAKDQAKQKAKEFDEKCVPATLRLTANGAAPCFASGVLTASALAQARGQREEGRGGCEGPQGEAEHFGFGAPARDLGFLEAGSGS